MCLLLTFVSLLVLSGCKPPTQGDGPKEISGSTEQFIRFSCGVLQTATATESGI